jgi:beta-1,4-mannosyl-glycoprotein beta-1,4-N-acetylglucosaminyltransferase
MKIFDCFLFFDEDIQLDVRLNTLDQYIDKFVIVESVYTHSGEKRDPLFKIQKYNKFKDKIIYILLDQEPKNLIKIKSNTDPKEDYKKILNANSREVYQRNAISEGIKKASDEDYIIISDVDEIPNLKNINFLNIKKKFLFFEQIFFCYRLNLFSEKIVWRGSRMIKKKHLISPQWLRDIKDKNYPFWRIDTLFSKKKYRSIYFQKNGGWHFSYIKDAKGVENKLKSIRHHVDYDLHPIGIEGIEGMIKNKKLIYNYNVDQRENKFSNTETLKILNMQDLPKYIYLNQSKFKNWIYKEKEES